MTCVCGSFTTQTNARIPRMSPVDLGLECGERATTTTLGNEGLDRGIGGEDVFEICQVLV